MKIETEMTNEMAAYQANSPGFLKSWLWVNILYLFPASLTAPLWDLLFPDLEQSLRGFLHDWLVPFFIGNLISLLFLCLRRAWKKARQLPLGDFVPLTPAKALVAYIFPFALSMTIDIAVEAWWTVPPEDRGDYAMGSWETFCFTYGMELLVFWGLAILLTVLTDSISRLFRLARQTLSETKEKRQAIRADQSFEKPLMGRVFTQVFGALRYWVKANICYIIPGALIWPLWGFFMGNGDFMACLTLWGIGVVFGNVAALVMIALLGIVYLSFRALVRGFAYSVVSKDEATPLQMEVREWFVHNFLFLFPSALLIFLQGTGIFSLQSTIGDWDWGAPLGRTFFISLVFWGVSQVVSYFSKRIWEDFFEPEVR
ncbi:hypothetical protein FAI40_03465 [Acetobacteraceae bacterium]|nr:hypothetical protein FAI40_03465 [Acetobacteraceae bacterium]